MAYDYYDDDYYDDYDYYYPSHRRYTPDYSDIKSVTEWMKSNMCYGIGARNVCKFLQQISKSDNDAVADMYNKAIMAELESAGAKYGGGSYSSKEQHISGLLRLCFSWRDAHATRQHLPDLEKRIEQVIKSNMKQKKKNRRINELRNTIVYEYDSPENVLKFAREYSGIMVAPHIYYFELPGCEQISFHSNLEKSSGGDKISWDYKENSTLIKLNCAVTKRYGERLKEEFSISDVIYNSFNKMTEQISGIYRNMFTTQAYSLMNAFLLSKMFSEKTRLFNDMRMSDMFSGEPLFMLTSRLPDTIETKILSKLLVYFNLSSSLMRVSTILPDCWIEEFTKMTEDIKAIIDDHSDDCRSIKYEIVEEDNTMIVKIGNNVFKLILCRKPYSSIFFTGKYTTGFTKIEKLVFDKYAKEYLPDLYDRHIKAEEQKELRRLEKERAEKERKERERQSKFNEIMSYEYFTKSMMKECLLWTDTLINKFAGEPDELKPNPMYRCAEPMNLYKKERIFNIEKRPDFVAELKKSYKRRHLEWPYENDVIDHKLKSGN